MYAEQFSVDPSLEEAAKFLQWIQGDASNLSPDKQTRYGQDQRIRYNLNQFWTIKSQLYAVATQPLRNQLNMLDSYAHQAWSSLEHAEGNNAAAQQAMAGVATLQASGIQNAPTQAPSHHAQRSYTPAEVMPPAASANGPSFWTKPLLGIPTWEWIAAGGGLVAVLLLTSGKK